MKHVAVGVIVNNGRVLACQRKPDAKYPLKWEFPGGKLEQDETPETAVIRELREELSIEAVVESELYVQEWTYPESASDRGNDGSFMVTYFLIREFSGTPVNKAFAQIRWVTPEELARMDILEGNRRAVELIGNANDTHRQREAQSNFQK